MNQKAEKYLELIAKAKNAYSDEKEKFKWCDECKKAINLWTYWQGLGYEINAPKIKILLVGQDWGNANDDNASIAKTIMDINALKPSEYEKIQYLCKEEKFSPTDKHLIELFNSIGYANIDKKRYSDLFFTNICLGYRKINTSAHIDKSEVAIDEKLFKELCDILEPSYIICLGRITYEIALNALGLKMPKIKSFNDYIGLGQGEVYKNSKIFAVAHPGAMGTMNRNRKSDKKGIELQLSDWVRIFKQNSENSKVEQTTQNNAATKENSAKSLAKEQDEITAQIYKIISAYIAKNYPKDALRRNQSGSVTISL